MTEITPQMREAADRAVKNAAGKSKAELAKQGKEVGLSGEMRAKYKIEITFGAGRTMHGPNVVGIQVWESGRRLNGGGDDLTFWCLSTEGKEGCGDVILSDYIKGGVAYCKTCARAVNAELLTNMKIGRITTTNLATAIEKTFRSLGSNADIYLKYHKTDVRYAAQERAKGPEVARRLKGMHIYPLKNILKDTANGAALHGRFHAFLTS